MNINVTSELLSNVPSAVLHILVEFEHLILGPPAVLGQLSIPAAWGFKNWDVYRAQ